MLLRHVFGLLMVLCFYFLCKPSLLSASLELSMIANLPGK